MRAVHATTEKLRSNSNHRRSKLADFRKVKFQCTPQHSLPHSPLPTSRSRLSTVHCQLSTANSLSTSVRAALTESSPKTPRKTTQNQLCPYGSSTPFS